MADGITYIVRNMSCFNIHIAFYSVLFKYFSPPSATAHFQLALDLIRFLELTVTLRSMQLLRKYCPRAKACVVKI